MASPEKTPVPVTIFRFRKPAELTLQELIDVRVLYKGAYDVFGLYIGDEKYDLLTLPTSTEIATFEEAGELIAAANLNTQRIGIIASKKDKRFIGRGFVGQLISKIQSEVDGSWITVSLDDKAHGMMAAVTSEIVKMTPVNDIKEIYRLFSGINLKNPRELKFREVQDKFLQARLAKIGNSQNLFTAVSAEDSLHGKDYWQIVFKTKIPHHNGEG
jgi:hypothetical protein